MEIVSSGEHSNDPERNPNESEFLDEIEIPSYRQLMFPALQALKKFGGSVEKAKLDEQVSVLLDLSVEQLSVEYPDDAQVSGSKISHRLSLARTYLRKLGAIDSPSRGVWQLTDAGSELVELGEAELLHKEHELRVGKSPEQFLKRAAEAAESGQETVISVRSLLAEWDVSRRGSSVVARIQRDLKNAGLQSEPPFESMPQAGEITLCRIANVANADAGTPETEVPSTSDASMMNTIGALDAAGRGVVSVNPEDGVLRAQSLMEAHDYSQLAVMKGDRNLLGVISWESIARATLYGQKAALVKDALQEGPVEVYDGESLLAHVRTIAEAGYVFVRSHDKRISGIVTAADLSIEFENLANPFLILGEIESWLRRIVDSKFSPDDLAAYVDPGDPDRQVEAAESLTFGEYVRLLQSEDAWSKSQLAADRVVFIKQLDEVRRIRNSIMHFSTDPLEDAELRTIKKYLEWVKRLGSNCGEPDLFDQAAA